MLQSEYEELKALEAEFPKQVEGDPYKYGQLLSSSEECSGKVRIWLERMLTKNYCYYV